MNQKLSNKTKKKQLTQEQKQSQQQLQIPKMKKKQIDHKITDNRKYQNAISLQYKLNLPTDTRLKKQQPNTHRKDQHQSGLSYYENFYHNYNRGYKSHMNSIEGEKEESECLSIQNAIVQGFLTDLTNLQDQIQIKSNTIKVLENLVRATEEEMKNIKRENEQLIQKLEQSKKRIEQLESEIRASKINRYEPSSAKKSITKTYITEKNISNEPLNQPMQLISVQIFNEFAVSYESLIQQISNWVLREQQLEVDNGMFNKINSHCVQIEDFLYGKSDEQYSKSTYETLQNQNKYSDQIKRYPINVQSQIEYEQIISMYKQYCNKQSGLLCECINYIQNLTKSLQNTKAIFGKMISPRTSIPPELIKIVVKQCNKIITSTFKQLKQENLQLVTIMNEMISWIQKNCKNGDQVLKSWSSSMY